MAKMSWKLGLTEGRRRVVIELQNDGKPLGHLVYGAADLEEFIRNLAKLRANMAEQVPLEIDPDAPLEATPDARVHLPDAHSASQAGPSIALRHPGLGWLAFVLPRATAEMIGRALLAQTKLN